MKGLYQLLYNIDRIFRKSGLSYWITRKTLIGAVEVGGIIKGDSDVDIVVLEKDIPLLEKLSSELLSTCGYKLSKVGENYKISLTRKTNLPAKTFSDPFVDIKIGKENSEGKITFGHGETDFYTKDDVFPLKKYPMQSFLVYGPKIADNYIKRTYKRKTKISLDKDFKVSRKVCVDTLSTEEKMGNSPLNKFCSRVFVISLPDQIYRLERLEKQTEKLGITFTVFEAIDGRGKTDLEKSRKRGAFQREYKVKIPNWMELPPASLTLGTYLILKEMIRKKWKYITILEDDALFTEGFNEKLEAGIRDLPKDWDLFYLGCGGRCGNRGVSFKPTEENKYLTTINKFDPNAIFYVSQEEDIRSPCTEKSCPTVSNTLSKPQKPGGTYGYIISQKGARKLYKIIGGRIEDHIDQYLNRAVQDGKLKAVAFDPPVVLHTGGADRPDSTIEWDWGEDEYEKD